MADGQTRFHLATRDLGVAFRPDDIAAFKGRPEEKGVPYANCGNWAMNGWYQIVFQDPEGSVIEVRQVAAAG